MRFNNPLNLLNAVAGNGIAVIAVGVALVPAWRWAGFALGLAALGISWWQDRPDGLARSQLARSAALIAVLAASVGGAEFGAAAPMLVAGTGLLLLIGNERLLAVAIDTGRLETRHLAVARGSDERYFTPRFCYGAISAVTGLLALAGAVLLAADVAWPAWAATAATIALGAALAAGTYQAWRRRRRSAHSGDASAHRAVRELRPEFLVHFAGPPGSEYQIRMWLPYFDALGDPYAIVLRDRTHLEEVASATSAPVVLAPGVAALERLLVPSVKAVFYVNNSMQNTQLVRFGHLTHVQLMHGDSDKAVSRSPVAAMYDLVFVAGQAGVDRYRDHGVDIPEHRFRIVGRPQLHDIAVGPRASRGESPVVLYTPTWTGASDDVNYSSLPIGSAIVAALLARGATVLLRAHPFTGYNQASARQLAGLERMLAADAERTGRPHLWGAATADRMSLADCVNSADAAVSDVSGAASDWLHSGKPFALTDMRGEGAEFGTAFPLSRAAYRIDSDAGNIESVADELLTTDTLKADRERTRAYYLGGIPPERCVPTFLEAARECYRPAAAPAPGTAAGTARTVG